VIPHELPSELPPAMLADSQHVQLVPLESLPGLGSLGQAREPPLPSREDLSAAPNLPVLRSPTPHDLEAARESSELEHSPINSIHSIDESELFYQSRGPSLHTVPSTAPLISDDGSHTLPMTHHSVPTPHKEHTVG
jgi:hypothetical protein